MATLMNEKEQMALAEKIALENNCSIEPGADQYQTAKIVGDGVKLVIYPHKSTAGNYHLRIRDENSKDPVKALAIANALDVDSGFSCTFQMKHASWRNLKLRASQASPTKE